MTALAAFVALAAMAFGSLAALLEEMDDSLDWEVDDGVW